MFLQFLSLINFSIFNNYLNITFMRSEFYFGKKLTMMMVIILSLFTIEFAFSATYCTPTVTNIASYGIGVAYVEFGTTIANTTGTPSVAPTYFDYSATKSVSARGGEDVTFKFQAGSGNTTQIAFWIDWNNDGVFNTTGNEFIFSSGSMSPSSYVTGFFTVPCGYAAGNYRIRVSGDLGNYVPGPCGNNYGDHEDYTFTMLASTGLDIGINAIDSPTYFNAGNNKLILRYANKGATTITTANFGYKLDNNAPVVNTSVTIPGTLATCITKQYIFPTLVSVPAGSHVIKVWASNPNGTSPDAVQANDTIKRSFATPISGTYVIDSKGTGNFVNFADAIAAMSLGGINGPIKFTVKKGLTGIYSGRVVIPQIPGVSATNTITFDGQYADSVKITYAGASNTSRATVLFDGADYVIFQNMTVENTGTSYGTSVFLTNLATYNTIQNCKLICPTTTSSNFYVVGIGQSEASMSTGPYNPASQTLFQDNLIKGGYYGAWLYSGNNSYYGYDNTFLRNDFDGQYYYGMSINNQWNFVARNNYIHNMGSTAAYGAYVYWSRTCTFDGNIINPGQVGIYFYYENVNQGSGVKSPVINNIICNFKNTSTQVGIWVNNYGGLNILHNSIWVNGNLAFNSGSSYAYAAIYLNYASSNPCTIQNNLLRSDGTTLLISAYYQQISANCDYNSYYYPNSTSDKFHWGTGGSIQYHSTLAQFQLNSNNINATHDVNSFENINPNFISSTNLHLSASALPLYGKYVGVTTDVDGNSRCAMSPTLGADESPYPYPAPNSNFSYPDTIYVANTVDFLSMSSKTVPYKYKWYLNGSSAAKDTLHDYSKTFTLAGTYTVMCRIVGCTSIDSTSHTFDVISPTRAPKAQFATSANVVTIFDQLSLKDLSMNGPDNWTWSISPALYLNPISSLMDPTYTFSGTSNMNSQNPSLFFLAAGTYTISLTVENAYGIDSVVKKDYIIVMPDIWMCAGEYISNNSYGKLYDDGGKLSNYQNGQSCDFLITPCSPKLKLIVRSFTLASGDYLKIYDGDDAQGKPMFNPTTQPNGFTGIVAANTTFVSTSGKFYIEFNTDGANVAAGFELEWVSDSLVNTPPKASFDIPDTICLNKTYLFQNTSQGYGNIYRWDLNNDGIPDNQPNEEDISAQFTAPYSDYIILAVENCGGVDTFRKLVTADAPSFKPRVGFYADNNVPNITNDIVTFFDTSYRCVDSWKWVFTPSTVTFKNSTNDKSNNPQVVFNNIGCYTVKLIAGINGNIDSLEKTCYITALSYCIPTVNTFMSDIGISNVKIGKINNASTITSTAYTNYSATLSTELIKGQQTSIEVKRATAFNAMSIAVWIDYNMDGDFTDVGEDVAYTASTTSLSWTANFTVPITAGLGATRMRIGTNMANKPNLPCGVNKNGEYEDYKIILVKDKDIPVITLIGKDTVTVEQWNNYSEKGAKAIDYTEGDISSTIIVTGTVDSSVFGTYYKKYNVTDYAGNKAIEVTRVVNVSADKTAPIINLYGGDTTIQVNELPVYSLPGFTALDPPTYKNYTSKVVVTGSVNQNKLGVYKITYSVSDDGGNSDSKTRTVTVVDTKAPVLVLNGLATITLDVNKPYIELGCSKSDNYQTNLIVDITGNVDTTKTGTYILKYDCIDSSGNKAIQLKRTVIVQDTIKPIIKLMGMDTITIEAGNAFLDPGASVSDNYCISSSNPNVAGSVDVNKIGKYTLTYSFTDCIGNVAKSLKRIVNVVDTKAPIIALVGHPVYDIFQWQEYVEDGYTVSDNYYTFSQIVVDKLGDYVNTEVPGTFYIQYKATDGSGNISYSEKRIIHISVSTSGIDNKKGETNNLIAYPNPANSNVKIYVSLTQLQPVSLVIYDIFGNEVEKVYTGKLKDKVLSLDVSAYSKGMYFIKLNTSDKQLTYKLIVN